ncbi:sugar phosphate isomerase/epimerase family protein [Haloferula sp. A504]|uniref:sugar phosphate isomerase/epimerase family protein n=1 Tax=Haloferula sp. A504 TaxID=3373601 RepID=UPI0031C9C50D|nr:sugar phosphate isomerase/epimerase [Verrucomicrobiaceae bacterium E54]
MKYPELALHTFTNRPWSMGECIEHYARRGIGGISVWRETIEGLDLAKVKRQMDDAGLKPVAHVRGGFFTGRTTEDRARAMETNRECVREAEALGLPMIVLVCGATPGQTPRENYEQIRDGIAEMAGWAAEAGSTLAIEPLHPVYAGDRSAINTMKTANDLCDEIGAANVGVALDVYHTWWDQDLETETRRCADAGRLLGYHICDYKPDQVDMLFDRGVMGEGCAPLREIDALVKDTGFSGFTEIEIFSRKWWSENQHDYLDFILKQYDAIYRDQPSDL